MNAQKRFFSAFIILMSIAVLVVGGYYASQAFFDMQKEDGIVVNKQEPYPLRKNATDLQKEIHENLEQAVKNNDKNDIAKYVAESYIADFYTWTNKERINDIGGIHLVHKDMQSWVYDKALETFYNDFAYYFDNKMHKNSLEVSNVNATVSKRNIIVEGDTKEAYQVELDWTYLDSTVLDSSSFQNRALIYVLPDVDGYFSIVEVSVNE